MQDNLNNEMVKLLQSNYRGYRARGVVVGMKRERDAAVLVQCGIRSSLARSAVLELREQRGAAIKLQTRARMSFAEKEVMGKRRNKQAAITIQSRLRRMKAREVAKDKREGEMLREMTRSATRIQCLVRKRFAWLYVSEVRIDEAKSEATSEASTKRGVV